jgi:hypothetical protein
MQKRLLMKVLRDLLQRESFETIADLADAFKYRLAGLRIPWTPDELTAAMKELTR